MSPELLILLGHRMVFAGPICFHCLTETCITMSTTSLLFLVLSLLVISVIGVFFVVVAVVVVGRVVSLPKKTVLVTWISRGSSSELLSRH